MHFNTFIVKKPKKTHFVQTAINDTRKLVNGISNLVCPKSKGLATPQNLRTPQARIPQNPNYFFLKNIYFIIQTPNNKSRPPRILRISVKFYIEPLIPLENPQKPVESSESSYTQILSCQPSEPGGGGINTYSGN